MAFKSGVEGLDKLIPEGLPLPSTILLLGPPGAGKSTFALNFLNEGLVSKEKCIFVLTTDSPEAVMSKMKAYGMEITRKNNIEFIDCYTCKSGKAPKCAGINNLNDLTGLSVAVKQAFKKLEMNKGRIVIDSVSDFLIYCDEKAVFKLLQIIRNLIEENESVGVIVAEEGLHPDSQINTLNYITDGTIRMDVIENKRRIKIERMKQRQHSLQWAEFEITSDERLSVREFFR